MYIISFTKSFYDLSVNYPGVAESGVYDLW